MSPSTDNGSVDNYDCVKDAPGTGAETEINKFLRANSVKIEQKSTIKNVQLVKSETSFGRRSEKTEVAQTIKNASGECVHAKVGVKENASFKKQKPTSPPIGHLKLTFLVYCEDSFRDKVRQLLAEALCKVSGEVDGDLREKAVACDPCRVAVLAETAMFEKWGKSNGAQKFKYRSIMFNVKDPNNPDFRRKVLLGDIEPYAIPELTAEEMSSDERQIQNEKIKEKAPFNSQLGGPPQASTNEFTCSRCMNKKTTCYQLQTRSADEPMTTFVTCVNCNNRWKF